MASTTQDPDYWPIHIARSDGKGYMGLDHNPLDPNLDKDADQLERWEVIIAGHLQFQLAPKEEKRQFKLAALPKGYELRVAVRKDGGRDYYLYGHPAGIKSNYRTPGDFVLHLLWLISESADYAQCSCDLCIKMVEAQRQRAPPHQASLPPPAAPPFAVQAQPQPPAPGPMPAAKPPAAPASASAVPPGMIGLQHVFRVGELVWYKHSAWRLGVVLGIRLKQGRAPQADSSYDYILAPLGHALLSQQNVTKDVTDMRPFLTFSVPDVTVEELRDKSFESVDWREFANRYANEPEPARRAMKLQVVGLEASKIAARSINDSFSTFNQLGEGFTSDHLYRVQSFTGVYLGAEMIRVSDPIRVTPPAAIGQEVAGDQSKTITTVMLVSEIQLLTPAWPSNDTAAAAAGESLQFRGNIYRTARALVPHPPTFVNPGTLGPAFEHELAGRNQIERDKKFAWGWMLIESNAVRAEADVQGRFYVTHKLMNIMDPARLQDAMQRGIIEEAQAYLNSRSHSGWNGRATIGRSPGRAASIGNAVTTQFIAPQGLVED
ncbi:transcription-silencing protein Clr2-domain-containing protein [Podospora aff. communis PSN243]|uniref:Transcription-silencing protein Clr2-domain-containing protein n=1 Tax=Podospora aff. communis PSN243 TaxID=3040156 RepID=A0AAV9GPB9_9PEZI|nr:transcription-silencing protein Clr2-domain-containing protein [Podospora aff. communis PSN243]